MESPTNHRSALLAPFYPSLDGLRTIAVGLVFVIHFVGAHRHWAPVEWGWIGVDIFFVLSGFLITGILFDSLHRPDYFRNFYIRRTLRIFPLYYAVLLCIAMAGLLPGVHVLWNRYNLLYFVYLGNLVRPAGIVGLHPDVGTIAAQIGSRTLDIFAVGHFWSLCVEEQFYLVWPAVLYLIRSRKALLWFCLVVIVSEPALRVIYLHRHPLMLQGSATSYLSWFRADTLLVGAALALWLRGPSPLPAALRTFSISAFFLSIALLVILWHTEPSHPLYVDRDWVVATFGFSLIAIASGALLLLAIDQSTWVARVLRIRALSSLGRISYGLYVFHGLINQFLLFNIGNLHRVHLPGMSIIVIGPILTVGVAALSFRYFESYFLALKTRLAPRHGAADDPPPFLEPQQTED